MGCGRSTSGIGGGERVEEEVEEAGVVVEGEEVVVGVRVVEGARVGGGEGGVS